MRRKIKCFFIVFFSFISISRVSAAGLLVSDLENIATAIENGLTMYNQFVTQLNQYKILFDEYKRAIEDMAGFDFQNMFDFSNAKPGDWTKWADGSNALAYWHGAWDGGVGLINSFQNDIDYMENIKYKKRFQIGSYKFSWDDMFGEDFLDTIGGEIDDKLNFKNMDESDRIRFFHEHGMTYDHYQKMKMVEQVTYDVAKEVVMNATANEEKLSLYDAVMEGYAKALGKGDTTTMQNLQIQSNIASTACQITKGIAETINEMNMERALEQQEKLAEKKRQEELLQQVVKLPSVKPGDYAPHQKGIAGDDKDLIGPLRSEYKYSSDAIIQLFIERNGVEERDFTNGLGL